MTPETRELLNKFDGSGADADRRLAWYGQCRAAGMTHAESIADTARNYYVWVREVWPKRGIEPRPEELP